MLEQLQLDGVTPVVSAVSADDENPANCGGSVVDTGLWRDMTQSAVLDALTKGREATINAVAYKVRRQSDGRWSRGSRNPFGGRDGAGKAWSRLADVRSHLRQYEPWAPLLGPGSLADLEVVELRSSSLFAGRVVPALELLG